LFDETPLERVILNDEDQGFIHGRLPEVEW
jgi:hypothetical protein